MDMKANFLELWKRVGGEPGAGLAAFEELAALYGEEGRFYHNLAHIEFALNELSRVEEHFGPRPAVEMALWYHDAVYDVRAKENELKSALMAKDTLMRGGASEEFSSQVYRLILATAHGETEEEIGEAESLIIDLDLAILGQNDELYRSYTEKIRQEYAYLEDDTYKRGRRAVLEDFLRRASIYRLALFRECYEERARFNLRAEIERLF